MGEAKSNITPIRHKQKPVADQLWSEIFHAEDDVCTATDYARILFNALSQRGGLEAEDKSALCRLTADLLSITLRVLEHHNRSVELAKLIKTPFIS